MRFLFEHLTSLGGRIQGVGEKNAQVFADYYEDYFTNELCTMQFLMGIGIALALVLVFYYVIGTFLFSLSKRWMWCIMMVLTFVSTCLTSATTILGSMDSPNRKEWTGIYGSSTRTEDTKMNAARKDLEKRATQKKIANDFRKNIKDKNLHYEIGIANGIFSMVAFFVFSLAAKKKSRHCSNIPF